MNHPRTSLHIIILNGKLYVIGGLKYTLPINYYFIEFFYPNIGTWKPLPNPPFHCQPSEMVTTLFENRKKKSLLLPLIVLFFLPTMSMIIHSQTLILLCPRSYLRVFFFCHLIWLNLLVLVTCCIGFPSSTMIIPRFWLFWLLIFIWINGLRVA